MKSIKISYLFLILFLFSSILSLIYIKHNIKNYDKNILDDNGRSFHLMIKNDTQRYFSHGYEIKKQIDENYNYFDTGRDNFTKYLFPRIIALYYKIFDYELYENEKNKVINLGIHQNFLIFQILLYYLSVFFLYTQIKHKINNKFLFFAILFLCLEPTIFQYHGSFWSESIFFSLQVLIMALILNNKNSNLRLFFIGILLSFLALQRTNGFYYLIPVLMYFYFSKESNFLKKISFILLGFVILVNFVSYHNFKISGKFFIIPKETKSVLNAYVLPNILDKNEMENEKNRFFSFLETNNIEIDFEYLRNADYPRYAFVYCSNDDKKNTTLTNFKICDYFDKRSKKIVIENPFETLKYVARNSLSFALLNPFHIYSDHKFQSGEMYYKSDLHQSLLPYRVIYTLLIYFICFVGLIKMIKAKENKMMLYLLISAVYFFIILSWHGNNRYFTPVLIYASLFFGYGFSSILNFLDKALKSNKIMNS